MPPAAITGTPAALQIRQSSGRSRATTASVCAEEPNTDPQTRKSAPWRWARMASFTSWAEEPMNLAGPSRLRASATPAADQSSRTPSAPDSWATEGLFRIRSGAWNRWQRGRAVWAWAAKSSGEKPSPSTSSSRQVTPPLKSSSTARSRAGPFSLAQSMTAYSRSFSAEISMAKCLRKDCVGLGLVMETDKTEGNFMVLFCGASIP